MNQEELKANVEKALQEIRPFLQLECACLGCSVNQMTLKNGVEATIKKHAPQIKRVIEISGIKF